GLDVRTPAIRITTQQAQGNVDIRINYVGIDRERRCHNPIGGFDTVVIDIKFRKSETLCLLSGHETTSTSTNGMRQARTCDRSRPEDEPCRRPASICRSIRECRSVW